MREVDEPRQRRNTVAQVRIYVNSNWSRFFFITVRPRLISSHKVVECQSTWKAVQRNYYLPRLLDKVYTDTQKQGSSEQQ